MKEKEKRLPALKREKRKGGRDSTPNAENQRALLTGRLSRSHGEKRRLQASIFQPKSGHDRNRPGLTVGYYDTEW